MNTIDPITSGNSRTGSARTAARRGHLVAIIAAALLMTTACGADPATDGTDVTATTSAATTTSTATPTTAVPLVPSTVTAPITSRPTATVDRLVGDEGRRMHVRCVGEGDTTVLLIAGFEATAAGWGAIEPVISARSRVCSYDHPGTGTSDPPTAAETFTTQATGLHQLLTTIGEPGPYVVVGHSFGGATAVSFASLFAGEVTGLVLVDASPSTWPAAFCAVPDDGSQAAAISRTSCTTTFFPTGNSERLDVVAAFAEVSRIVSLGSLPMAVITATERELPGLASPEVARLTEVWNQGQQDWAALSTAAHVVTVEHTGHHIELDQPGVVIDEITRLLP